MNVYNFFFTGRKEYFCPQAASAFLFPVSLYYTF